MNPLPSGWARFVAVLFLKSADIHGPFDTDKEAVAWALDEDCLEQCVFYSTREDADVAIVEFMEEAGCSPASSES